MSQGVAETIEMRPNRAGQPRAFVAGTRVRVQDIYALSELHGKTPDEIVVALPHLSLWQVHSALAYCFQHRASIVQEMRDDETLAAAFRSQSGPGPLASKFAQAE